jgi:hypothetical protein
LTHREKPFTNFALSHSQRVYRYAEADGIAAPPKGATFCKDPNGKRDGNAPIAQAGLEWGIPLGLETAWVGVYRLGWIPLFTSRYRILQCSKHGSVDMTPSMVYM